MYGIMCWQSTAIVRFLYLTDKKAPIFPHCQYNTFYIVIDIVNKSKYLYIICT